MTKEDCISISSANQLKTILDNAPVAVYVSDIETRELLYANKLAAETFLHGKSEKKNYCYHAAGFNEPCPFCKAEKISGSELLIREFHHAGNDRIYQLNGRIIQWNGKSAHIEYIIDITAKKKEEQKAGKLGKELQEIFRSIPCGLCVYGFDGVQITPLFHNAAFYEIMGYSEDHIKQMETKTNYLGVHPDDLSILQEKIDRAVRNSGTMQHTYRVWNDKKEEYHWIRLEGSVKRQKNGTKFLYGVYSDVSERVKLETELTAANEKMQDIINAIPGGVAIYKVSDIFETVYFSDGVPEMSGYSVEEYRELVKRDAAEMTYAEDTAMVVEKARRVIRTHEIAEFEFRKQHKKGHVVWVRARIKWMGEEDGLPLLHCVFHNVSALKETQLEMDHLVNSIPGGIASYRVEGERFIPTYYSDGVMALSGYTRAEFMEMVHGDAFNMVYEPDRERVLTAAKAALKSGEVLDVSYRMRHKDGNLIWIHLNGRRMDPLSDGVRFYAVFTGMSAETHLFQSIANESADGIYVVSKDNYDLLYVNESKKLFTQERNCLGQKCYAVLHRKSAPCAFCTLKSHEPDGEEHEMEVPGSGCFYTTRFRETDWNGVPAYIKYVRDVTEEVKTRKEKERLEQYFQTVVKHLPGGVAVVRYEEDGRMVPEYLSNGFAAMTGMTMEEAWRLYQEDAVAGVHPDDLENLNQKMEAYIAGDSSHCEIVYRLRTGNGGYIWVKNTLSLIQNKEGERRVYAVYHDMTKEREEQEQIQRQYNELIVQHYRTPGPNAIVVGHCNITKNRILEIIDYTNSALLKTFGTVRQDFFRGLSTLVTEEKERQAFLDVYLNEPALAAFQKGDTERILDCFVKLPQEMNGRYVRFKMNLVETPDTGDITGILTVTDITEQMINDRILHQLSVASCDLVVDVDVTRDRYTILTCDKGTGDVPGQQGCHSERIAHILQEKVVPRDKERTARMLDRKYMVTRLKKERAYSISYSITSAKGDILTKNLTVSAVDLRLGRVCFARTDITNSVQEQQGLLNMIAYTFELAAFIDHSSRKATIYTRQTVLENLAPYAIEDYTSSLECLAEYYDFKSGGGEAREQLCLETMIKKLREKPEGYDFVLPYKFGEGVRYKQINVLWGDENHRTVCMVRADVTDMLTAERKTKDALEKALTLAEEANRAKSDFLSAMSHDIRTPMNAIMGMTELAVTHKNDPEQVADCLEKISISSKHLLSLINDILDMSKIERSQITLNHMAISLEELSEQLSVIMLPQAREAGLAFHIRMEGIRHGCFYGDALRVNQIFINLLSNAIKFTPEGGEVDFLMEEIPPAGGKERVRYRFTVSDTGIGMPEGFLDRIFDPFTRSDIVERIEGTGLGLSITKGLVELMGGMISVESRVGKGSVFRVELEGKPAQKSAVNKSNTIDEPALGKEETFPGRCFLVVEDNAINTEIICGLLNVFGARATVKINGAQAVEAFRDSPPGTYDAILMDIQMPVMDGYEATRTIRKMERADAKTIPIIAMTANAFAEDVQASLDAGMTAHVAKPIDVKLLRSTLYSVLKHEENLH